MTCGSCLETVEEETPEAVVKGLIGKTRQYFEGMQDPRKQCPALRHDYVGILTMVAVATMFGMDGPTAVVRFWHDMAGHRPRRMEGLLRALGLKKQPSHDAIGRVMALTDPAALDQAVQAGRRLKERRGTVPKRHRHIAIDGKACRGSASQANAVEAAMVVNAVDVDTKQVLATVATPGPGQEVPTARTLLVRQDIDCDGAIVSFDAAHCCRETLSLVRSRGGDWLVPVKGNTPTLRDEILFSLDAAKAEVATVHEKGHGRIDTRIVWVVADPETCEWLGRNHGCEGLRTIGHIVYITKAKDKKPTREECAFICSRRMSARDLLAEARKHWEVEVRHNRLDVVLGEDASRVRIGWGWANFAILRRLALDWLDMLRGKNEPLPAAISRLRCGFAVAAAMEDAAMAAA
jgi:predicted transposase YbfD/YdcC